MMGRKGRARCRREEGRVIINLIREKGNKGQLLSGEGLDRGGRDGGELRDSLPLLRSLRPPSPSLARPIARIVVSSGTTSTIIINKTCL